jgi:hypothetical protein
LAIPPTHDVTPRNCTNRSKIVSECPIICPTDPNNSGPINVPKQAVQALQNGHFDNNIVPRPPINHDLTRHKYRYVVLKVAPTKYRKLGQKRETTVELANYCVPT